MSTNGIPVPAAAAGRDLAFVVGPGRSGTTLLYKLLCLHPDVAYLTNFETRLSGLPVSVLGRLRLRDPGAKLTHWFNEGGNAYLGSRPWLRKVIPNPVEGEVVYARLGWAAQSDCGGIDPAAAERLRGYFEALRKASGARIMLSKRTANNRRIQTLESVFGQPRYVNLVRDGREVADSLARVEWWLDHPLWWDAERRSPAAIVEQGGEMLELCARNWVAEVDAISAGLAAVDASRVLDVRYEDLLAEPIGELCRILDFLGLPRAPAFAAAVTRLGLAQRPARWRQAWSAADIDRVEGLQRGHLERLGYAP